MSTEQHIENIPIADINVKGRIRQDAGNLDDLAKSIESVGLLHPVVLTQDYKLIVGGRRIAAFLHLKRDTIPAIIVSEKWELAKLLEAEGDENTCRKALTPEEAVHLGQNVEKAFADMAKAKQKAGGGDKKSSKAKSGGVNPPTLIPEPRDEGARTKAQAAAVAGMERQAYTRAGSPHHHAHLATRITSPPCPPRGQAHLEDRLTSRACSRIPAAWSRRGSFWRGREMFSAGVPYTFRQDNRLF